ncbi:MAG: hypothetical protein ACRBBK_12750 [Paracoccaceae bacterium]
MSRMFSFSFFDRFLGRGAAAVTVPPLDGGLKPNNRLEELPPGIAADQPDDIVLWQGRPVWSDGARICDSSGDVITDFGSEITALAAHKDRLAVATLKSGLHLFDPQLTDITPAWSAPVAKVTALTFAANGALFYCTGSTQNAPDAWRRDLMEKNSAGLVGRVDCTSGKVQIIRENLAYPAGIVSLENGSVVVSEAWKSHLVEIDSNGALKVILDEIPGYPGRLIAGAQGGYWLCIFAPRSPLIEFVLREDEYRTAMLSQLDPAHWVAPNYASGASFQEPMQGGALKQMGILKPWAPTLSYGLVAALSAEFIPQESFHSRAGGRRHGMTSAVEHDGALWIAGRGAQEILTIALTTSGETL